MSRSLRRALVCAAVCFGLPACAVVSREYAPGSPPPADSAGEASTDDTVQEVEAGGPLASDPYVRRPHGLGGGEQDADVVRFARPSEIKLSGRWTIERAVSVGVVLVSDGVIADPKTLVLELEGNLARDEQIRRVVALRGMAGESLGLAELALLAAKQSHDILLVDVLPGPEGSIREGFWLYPAGKPGEQLIAHVVVEDAEGGLVGPPTFPDVWDRLATAHYRLPVPESR